MSSPLEGVSSDLLLGVGPVRAGMHHDEAVEVQCRDHDQKTQAQQHRRSLAMKPDAEQIERLSNDDERRRYERNRNLE